MKKLLKWALLTFLLLGFTANIHIMGPITTRRLCCVIAVIALCRKGSISSMYSFLKRKRILLFFLFILGICLPIIIFNSSGGNTNKVYEYFEWQYFIYIIGFVFVFGCFCIKYFRNTKEFAYSFIAVFLFQAVITYLSAINTTFRLILYQFLGGDGRFDDTVETGSRVIALGLVASAGSIIMSTSCILLVYMRMKRTINNYMFTVFFLMIAIATAFIGRTGVVIEVIVLLSYFILDKSITTKLISISAIVGLAVFCVGLVLSYLHPDVADSLLEWMTNAFDSEYQDRVITGIYNQGTPAFSDEFIFGTGVMVGFTPDGSFVGSDSGYVRLYSSMGVIGALFYYLAYYNLFRAAKIEHLNISIKLLIFVVILIAFVIEYKEPYSIKYVYPWFVFVFTGLIAKEHAQTAVCDKPRSKC